jgi:hypothetical protein
MTDFKPNRDRIGQFAEKHQSEAANVALEAPEIEADWVDEGGGLTIEGGVFDTLDDGVRYEEAAAFIEETGIEGTVSPVFTKFRPEDGLDAVNLNIDGRNMVLRHAGTKSPQIEYSGDGDDAWTFRMEAGDGAGKTEYEILHDLVISARHDAACQDAWRSDDEAFRNGNAEVTDFGVRYAPDGTRIVTLDVKRDGRFFELIQRGDEDVQVHLEGEPLPLPHIQLDAIAFDFDDDHMEGTGDILFRGAMRDAADRAAKDPGYNPRGLTRP